MLKKTITFEDFNGDRVSEDHFFHLSKADLIELEMSKKGGLSEWIKTVIANEDAPEMVREFKNLILMAYGQKSADGRRFIRTQELRDSFVQSEAYSTLFLELCTSAEAQAEFINGIVPNDLHDKMELVTSRAADTPEQPLQTNDIETGPRVLTRNDAMTMSHDELSKALAEGAVISKD